eukprot:CAMPEP_0184296896 /NCGR_PEP_ID=MMETSP1049-20130417/7834_1 /TAXON_ID=77928 /ORGANISM="Proteomonas sulcata, Strain CCMP704" /LENGTH=447 /DNA_ID=CAMNT_0026606353 /DNA_START=55 /DNA_END=1395 /DNA_ORIENTATION=-
MEVEMEMEMEGLGNSTSMFEEVVGCDLGASPVGETEMHVVQWIGSFICIFQCLWFLSKWPNFTWDTPYIPAVEAVGYGLMANGFGYAELFEGERHVPWLRYSIWVLSTPVLLWDIQDILDAFYRGTRLAPVQSLANLFLLCFGFIGAIEHVLAVKYLCYSIGVMMLGVVFFCAYNIVGQAVANFEATDTAQGRLVAFRLKLIACIFMTSFSGYPILWILSNQGLCLVPEMIIEVVHIPLDLIAKNLFTLLTWHTHYILLNGDWSCEAMVARLQEQNDIEMAQQPREAGQLRKDLMQKAQGFFGLADVCLKHADTLMNKASDENAELVELEQLLKDPLPASWQSFTAFTEPETKTLKTALGGAAGNNARVVQQPATLYQSLPKVECGIQDHQNPTSESLDMNSETEAEDGNGEEVLEAAAASVAAVVPGSQGRGSTAFALTAPMENEE